MKKYKTLVRLVSKAQQDIYEEKGKELGYLAAFHSEWQYWWKYTGLTVNVSSVLLMLMIRRKYPSLRKYVSKIVRMALSKVLRPLNL